MRTGARIHDDFAACARACWPRLLVTARLLTEDLPEAEELARRTLVRVYARWRRVPRNDVDFHVRRHLVRSRLRRPWPLVGRAARQRAVLVLRYGEGLPDAQIGQLLGISKGAVRHVARRGTKAAGGDEQRLREAYAAVAGDVVPGPLPLDAVIARGRARRRRRAAVTAGACAVVLVAGGSLAVGRVAGSGHGESSGTAGSRVVGSVRIVAPGERVQAAPGVEMWLTADGSHWSTPQQADRFRGLDAYSRHEPGVSLQAEPVEGRYFLSGLYYGVTGDPGRVELSTGHRQVAAKVLTLAGSPGWGVWYATTSLSAQDTKALIVEGMEKTRGGEGVRVYDAAGAVVARLRSGGWSA
ncbi:sigma factor-like helix-turn-helix DNA-binding protein [Streptomyces cyanogenus]|uniref:Sigma-70, region 4 n=1 Tax=Streptomyces cyanogenus TaxID=80860 RepID=A0ABX7TRE2_STRCY|nr:sigma factor-like helix-turn-helix DNA-binding protein [Streptomyces cyanogenus]QTD99290.1 Sigma-70, region 4 [Streptomyces cyanogenus]